MEFILKKRVELSKNEIDALFDRWDGFIGKMRQRYAEVIDEGLVMAREILENNKELKVLHDEEYIRFVSMFESQLNGIVKKSQSVWNEQIDEHRGEEYVDNRVDAYGQGYVDWLFDDLYDRFVQEFDALYIQYHDPYKELEYIKTTYADNTVNLCCSQCGGNLAIEHLYVIPTYVACPYCSTKNTFTPPSVAFMAPVVAERIAAKESQELNKIYVEAKDKRHALHGERYEEIRAASKIEDDAYRAYINFYFDKAIEIMPDLKEKFNTQREMRIKAKKADYSLEF